MDVSRSASCDPKSVASQRYYEVHLQKWRAPVQPQTWVRPLRPLIDQIQIKRIGPNMCRPTTALNKKILPDVCPHPNLDPLQPKFGAARMALSQGNMRTDAAHSRSFLIFAAILICLFSPPIRAIAQEALAASISSTSSATASSPTTPTALPTEQTGTGIFSRLPFKLSISVRGGYDDNVSNSNVVGQQGSGYTTASVAATYEFGSPRTRLNLEAGVGYTYYWDTIRTPGTNNYDLNDYLSLSLVHKATPRLTLNATTYLSYQTEPDFAIAQGVNRRSGNYFFTSDKFGAVYLWSPRFSTATSYTLTALNYDDLAIGQFDDRFENTFGNEFRFLMWQTTTLVAEYRLQIVSYIHDSSRDSLSHYFLGGLDHTFNPRLTGSLRGGVQFVEYEQAGSQSSPYFDGSLNYVLGKQTSLGWTARYSIETADVASNQSRKTFRTGLNGNYNFTPRIRGSVGIYYSHDDYQDFNPLGAPVPGFVEDSIDMSLSLRYSVTRYWGVEAGYNYTDVSSDEPFREYSRNRYWAGLNVTF